jgi:type I restriction enzyme, S subunit
MKQETKIDNIQCPRISEICDIKKGKKVNSFKEKTPNSIPYLLIDTLRGMEPEYFTEDKKYTEAVPEDILIVADGANSGLVGTGVKGAVGSTILRIRINDNNLNKDYLSYFLKSKFQEFNTDMKGTGIPHLKAKKMLALEIRKPSPEEQELIIQEIEKQFTRLDTTIQTLNTVKKRLGIYKKAILNSAFTGKLVNQINYNKKKLEEEIEEFNKQKSGQDKPRRLPIIDYSNLPIIPESWTYLPHHMICSSVRDGTHDTPRYIEDGYPLITSKNLKNNKLDMSNVKFISKEDYEEIEKRSKVGIGDILFAMIGTIGCPTEIKEKPKFGIKNVALFKNGEQKFSLSKYLRYWLSSANYFNILEKKRLIKGTTQKFIDLGTLRASPIPICSIEEQGKIVQEIESKFSIIDKLEEAVDAGLLKSERLRKSILKSAFEGKLIKEDLL